jgi:hypothetical protein
MSGNWPVIFDDPVHKKQTVKIIRIGELNISCVLTSVVCCLFETFVNSRFQKPHLASIFGYFFRYDLGIVYSVSVVFFTASVT